ncbi:MAG: FAD-dependent oxidoreductase [Beijerinckiaceae bacterium]|jgi:monoamine oxidase|nr:FAD-dependent oxidoreductase [Beijerinckiaceae bacterium]
MISRRSLLAGSLAAPFLAHASARAQVNADIDVAIIGAGAAGLHAAQQARAQGLTARIFEARNRVGGRVFTDTSLGSDFEAGAFYIHWSETNPWTEIAKNLGTEAITDSGLWGGFDVFSNGRRLTGEERSRRRGGFWRLANVLDGEPTDVDMSFGEAARRVSPDQPEAASGMTLLSLGEDADRVSIRDYQRLDAGDDLVLPRGYGRLLERYAEGLDIALATPVSAVDFSGAGVQIETPRGTVRARAVIITASVNVLKSGAIRFTPELPAETRSAIDGLGMGALTKLALKFEGTKFGQSSWTQFFDSSSRGDLVNFEFWPWGNDLVVAHFGGDYARSVAAQGEAAAVEHMLGRFVAILGEDARKAFRGGRLAGWSADPYALGGYSIAKPGQSQARDALAMPVANRLWFAGEASAGAGSMTAGGAALAGARAIAMIRKVI